MGRFERLLTVSRWAVPLLLQGALAPAAFAAPANLHTVTPCRVFDSRLPADGPALSSGTARTINVAGVCGVPANASSAAVNVTVIAPTSLGYLRLYATGPAPGPFSAINFSAGQTRGNNALVQLSAGGQVDALTTMPVPGTVDVVLDVFGYFLDDASPTAVADSATVNEDALATTIDVLANDTDPDGGPIAVSSVTPPANGTVVITNGGADLTYQPDPDYCNAPPGTTPDTFTYTLSPGGSTAMVSVTVTCVNDAPVLGGAGTVAFTEDGPPVTVAPALTVADLDDLNLESATVMISNLLDTGFEILAVDTTGTAIVASYAAPNLTLTGTDTVANYQLVLRRVTYENTSGNPDNVPRFVAFVAHDGTVAGNILVATVLVNTSNDAPVLTPGGGSPTFTEDGPAVAVDPGLVVTDADDVNLESAGVGITNLLDAGQEVLAATTAGTSIVANYLAPILTLSGSDTLANYQAVLRSVTYANNSQDPTPTPRSISFIASDGTASSNTPTTSLIVVSVIDAPVLTGGAGSPTFTEDGAAVAVDPALSVTDQDDTNLESATVTITNLLNAGAEVLAASTGGTAIVASYVAPTLTLTGTDTLASYQAVLRSVTYLNSSQNPSTTARTIAFQANDGTIGSNVVNESVAVVAVNDAPTLTAGGGVSTFTEDGPPAVVDAGLVVADPDNANLASATVTITNLLNPGMEVLTANPGATGIAVSYIAPALTLTGSSSVANYQAVLRTVAYNNGSNAPNPTNRSLAFTVNDGTAGSNTAVATVQVVPVNDPPVLTTNPITYATVGNTQLHVAGDTLPGVASIADAQGALAKSAPTDVDGPVAPSVVAASGASANGGSFTIDTDGSFTYVPPVGFAGTDSFTYQVTDSVVAALGTVNVTVSSVVWYVRDVTDANNPPGGDGRSTNAFETLAAAQAPSGTNHFIFVFDGNTSTTPLVGGIALKDGQKLHGQGVGLSVPGFPSIVAAGNRPRIRTTAASTDVVSVPATAGARSNVEVRGLDLEAQGAGSNAVDVTSSGANLVGVTISNNTVRGATAEGIDLNDGSTGLFTATVQSNTIAATGNGFDARTSVPGELRVDFSTNTVVSSASAVVVDGTVGGLVVVTSLADNTINGNTAGNGILVSAATFDSTPGGPFQTVSAGTTAIGISGNGVGASAIVLTSVAGDLAFTDLDAFADNGAALRVTGTGAFTGAAGTRVSVGVGVATLAAVGGPAADLSNLTAGLPVNVLTSTNSATTGASLVNVDGSFSAPSGSAITNATGTDFTISGGTATVTYGGTITDDVGQLVSVASTTGGTKTFSGAITDGNDGDGSGVSLTNNAGATINFQGGLVLSTGANPAFAATGGGTVNVCDENPCAPATGGLVNTLTTTTGTPLNVTNTTIGTNGLTFRSISANGAPNGIVLNSTGSTGGLTVTGNSGGQCGGQVTVNPVGTLATVVAPNPADCTGGTIQNTTGSAISLTNTRNVSLTRIYLLNSAADSMIINGIDGFTLDRSYISDSAGVAQDRGIEIGNFSTGTAVNGAISLTNSTISPTPHDNLAAGISSGNSSWNIDRSVFGNSGNAGVNIEIRGAAVVTAFDVTNSSFPGVWPNTAEGVHIQPAGGATGSLTATIESSSFSDNNIAIDVNSDASALMTYRILNNTIINPTRRATATSGTGNTSSHAVNVFQATTSSAPSVLQVRVDGNVIGSTSLAGSGSSIGNCIRLNFNGNGQGRVLLNNNRLRECPIGRGIETIGRNGTGQLDTTFTGNDVNHVNLGFDPPNASGSPLAAILVQSNVVGVSGYTVRTDVRSNVVPAGTAFDLGSGFIHLQETSTSNLQLVDTPPASASCAAALASAEAANAGSTSANAGCSLIPGPIQTPP